MQNKNNNSNPFSVIMGILAVITVMLAVMVTARFIKGYEYKMGTTTKDLKTETVRERYGDLNNSINQNRYKMEKKSKEYLPYIALSSYMDDALLYNATKDEFLYDRMQDNRAKMGELSQDADKIDEKIKAFMESVN